MRYEFATEEPPRVRLGLGGGRIELETADVAETTIEVDAVRGDLDNLKVEQHGRDIVVESRKRFGLMRDNEYSVTIRAPHRTQAEVNVASGSFRATGRLGALEVTTASGFVQADEVEGDVKISSASGDVQLGTVGGKTSLNTASGDVQIAAVGGGGTIRSASGDVQIGEAASRVNLQTASGDIAINAIAEGSTDVKSASGDVRIGVKQGSRLHVDVRSLSGETTSEVELGDVETGGDGPLVEVKAATMSGDIRIVRA